MLQENILKGKIALVTGAGQGIGREIALTLAQSGCKVGINDLNRESATNVAQEIVAAGGSSIVLVHDVSVASEVQTMYEAIIHEFGQIDIVVNNAGIILKNAFWEITEEQWDRIIAVNLKSVFLSCQTAASYMRERRSGKIVNISSVAGKKGGGFLGNTAYGTSKAGVIALTKGVARELGPYGVNVNAITPGFIETDMVKSMTDGLRSTILGGMALKYPGKPRDIANAVLYLVSPLADFVTGEIMDVDGGLMMD